MSRRTQYFKTWLGAVWVSATLCGCSVYHADRSESYSSDSLPSGDAKTILPVQVDGSVGGVRGAALASAVTAAMPATVDDRPIAYASCEPYAECAGDHIVWTFGPPAARPASAYPPALATNIDWVGAWRPSPQNVTVKVTLIQQGQIVASAAGQVDAANPDDADFRSLIADLSDTVLSGPGLLDGAIP